MGELVRNGISYSGSVVDDRLKSNSKNPVQNKVVTEKLAEKVGFSDVDSALSETSENPVQNKVITDALGGKVGTTDYATAATAGIVKPDGITTVVGADGTLSVAVPNFYVDNNGYICINYGNS